MKKVLVFGTFDPLHKGHLDLFNQAKIFGDYLIVVVSPDEKIKTEKSREPRQIEKDRIKAIRQSGLANEVILGEQSGHYDLIDKIKPDIIAIGYDQIIPMGLKNRLKKYKIVRLKPYKPEIYKSSKLVSKAFFYILESCINSRYYFGSTTDLDVRIKMHNSGRVESTKPNIPWRLVYSEGFSSLEKANKREHQVKKWKSRNAVKRLMDSAGGPII